VSERPRPPAIDPTRFSDAFDDPEIYRTLVEGIPAIVYLDRPDEYSTNFYTSPQAVELLGYSPEEWGTNPDLWLRKIHPEDVDRVKRENELSNRTGQPFRSEYRMAAKDDRIVWIRDEAVMVYDERGEPSYWRGVMVDITAEREAQEKLRWSLEVLRRTVQQRRDLALRLEGAQEQERRRVASDIHDDPIQVMSAVDLRLQTLLLDPDSITAGELQALHETVELAIARLRSMVFELRPAALDREGIGAALSQYLDHVAEQTGWAVVFRNGLQQEPPAEMRASLFRIAQEALMNARKHASASAVEVTVASAGSGVALRVSDDGLGFDPRDRGGAGHLGLETSVERAELAGGWCRITSEPGGGTAVDCWLPVA
jgi:PAS domain S-box-containing protein